MSDFHQLKREGIPLLIGVAGGTGSGKTFSALLLARGLAGGKPFAGIDTENGRMNHYADLFPDCHAIQISKPFRPSKYADAVEKAQAAGYGVIVVDSASHEWYGDGGCLDWQEEIMDGKESRRAMAWIEPKKAHRRYMSRLTQMKSHVVLCFRADPKIDVIDDPDKPGKTKIIPKRSLTGLDGWIPIAEPRMPYELTASFLLMAEKPGVPRVIKLEAQHERFVPLDRPLSEETGRLLAAWAAGAGSAAAVATDGNAALTAAADVAPVPLVPSPILPPGEPVALDVDIATGAQQTLMLTKASRAGLDDDARHALITRVTGQPSTKAVPKALVNAVLDAIDAVGAVA